MENTKAIQNSKKILKLTHKNGETEQTNRQQ